MKVLSALSLGLLQILATIAANNGIYVTAFAPPSPSTSISSSHHGPFSITSTRGGDADAASLSSADSAPTNDTILFRQAATVGIVTAAMGHVYGLILDKAVKGVWTDLPDLIERTNLLKLGPSYIAFTIAIGGLLMGLLSTKLKPAYIVAEFVSAFSGPPDDDNASSLSLPKLMPALPNLLLLSLVTSTFGFSVGPEAPMVCAGALVGVAMARKWYHQQDDDTANVASSDGHNNNKRAAEILTYAGASGALTAFMGIPLAGPIFVLELTSASSGMASVAKDALGPAVAASAAALVLIRGILAPKSSIGGHFASPPVNVLSGRAAILTSLVCGVGGAVLGTMFHKMVHFMKDILWQNNSASSEVGEKQGGYDVSFLLNREVLVKTLIGIAVGLLSMLYPATMFWGEGSLQCVVDGHQTSFAVTKHGLSSLLTGSSLVNTNLPFQSPWAAAQVGCAKLLSIALACAGKFPGGIIFPLFFAAAPIAHAFISFLPTSVSPVAIMSLMASTQASVTRTPLATIFMLALSASATTEVSRMLPAVILSSYIGVWFSRYLSDESYFTYSK
mmetsp:Transcript_31597/g.66440  ORF Transcript_31597/g.66440 Transcript_31597/m.66440 type:complete len:562 (+) Transcript_31597:53-1738(+)